MTRWRESCIRRRRHEPTTRKVLLSMSSSEVSTLSLNENQIHRLLTLLTISGLNLGMLQRELTKDGTGASARTYLLVERILQAQRAMISELHPPPHEE